MTSIWVEVIGRLVFSNHGFSEAFRESDILYTHADVRWYLVCICTALMQNLAPGKSCQVLVHCPDSHSLAPRRTPCNSMQPNARSNAL